jgi:hypothetical protein
MKRYYHIWTDKVLENDYGFAALYTECDANGVVKREIGVDASGKAVYRFPRQILDGQRGIFEFMTIDLKEPAENLSAASFENAWQATALL